MKYQQNKYQINSNIPKIKTIKLSGPFFKVAENPIRKGFI